MKSPFPALFLASAILLAACSSTGGSGNGGDSPEPIEGVPQVAGQQVRVEWRNLNPKRSDTPLGLVNRSSPEMRELYRQPAQYQHVKPVDDETMGVVLQAFREIGFFDHAEKGRALEEFRPGEGQHGVVHVRQGDQTWFLLFTPGLGGTEVPEIYRDAKSVIIEVHRRTYWLQPTSPQDPDRVFRVPSSPYSGR